LILISKELATQSISKTPTKTQKNFGLLDRSHI